MDGYRRRCAITDAILADFRAAYETERGCVADQPQQRETAERSRSSNDPRAANAAATGFQHSRAPGETEANAPRRITKKDIFYYVYGVLHSPEYRTRFASDLKKMLPRLPFTRETADFFAFSQAGRDLANGI